MLRTNRSVLLTLIAATALVAAAPLGAQNAAQQPAAQQQGAKQQAPQPEPGRFDIEFLGGTVDQYVEAIRRAHPPANIVVLAGAGAYGVPAIRLRNVTVTAALSAVKQFAMLPSGASIELGVSIFPVEGSAEAVHQLQFRQTMSRELNRKTRVWSVTELLINGAKPADILGAIETALSLDDTTVEVRFHEPTQLIMVRGYPPQLDTVEEVLMEVDRSQANTRALTGDAGN